MLLVNSTEKWKTGLKFGGQKLGTVRIRRGINQNDRLSLLFFVSSLITVALGLREVKAKISVG